MQGEAAPKRARRLVLLALNEVNFEVVREYIETETLPNLKAVLGGHFIRTHAESDYEKLEPWIQWPSVHTGKEAAAHGLFRLGDIVGTQHRQIFELAEQHGIKVGSISAMNAENRLAAPAFFVPDPWTQTPTDGSWWSRVLSRAISQAVNDNASGRLTFASKMALAGGLIRFARPRSYRVYLQLLSNSRRRPWNKALILDVLLNDLHLKLSRKTSPGFTTLFLNAGAHIQHHYFFNAAPVRKRTALKNPGWYAPSSFDPILDMLKVYDGIVKDYLDDSDAETIIATGLSQSPYDRVKFYYRLTNHADFLRMIGARFGGVVPRMTRDFLIECSSADDAIFTAKLLASIMVTGQEKPLFGEIDNRGTSLFVTMTYPDEVGESTTISISDATIPLQPHVSFVAIKNGMHNSEGYAYFSPGVAPFAPSDGNHVKELHSSICNYLGIPSTV
jgi:hypothetical protein